MEKRDSGFWFIQAPGWLLCLYLVYAQAIPAFNYDLGVTMGTQEPASRITEIGTAFWYGFALGDLLIYIPLLAAALGITVYWPIVCLAAVADARGAPGWQIDNEAVYWAVLPAISLWGIVGLVLLIRSRR